MTAKEFLQQVFIAYQEADSKLEQIARLQSLATRTTTVIHSTPCGNGTSLTSRVEQAIVSIDEQSDKLADELKHFMQVRDTVADAINKITAPNERRLLEFRYLAFKSWKEISHSMKISIRYAYMLHERALKNFSEQFTLFH